MRELTWPGYCVTVSDNAEAHGSVCAKAMTFSAEDKDVEAKRGKRAHWPELAVRGLFSGCRDLRRTFPTGEERK
jgi:hypothetical protein